MCLAQGPQRSDTGEARTRCLSVPSQALYHWAPYDKGKIIISTRLIIKLSVTKPTTTPEPSIYLLVYGENASRV